MDVNWGTKIITVYRVDLALVSGTLYSFDTNQFRLDLKALEDDEIGMCFLDIHRHNTEVSVAGVTYPRVIEIINGYSITFDPDIPYSVRLEGSNNNIFDIESGILNQNAVQVIPTNSAGLQIVSIGSGLSTPEHDKLMTGLDVSIPPAVWDELEAEIVTKILYNKVTKAGNIITIYEDNGTDIWKTFDLSNGGRVEV